MSPLPLTWRAAVWLACGGTCWSLSASRRLIYKQRLGPFRGSGAAQISGGCCWCPGTDCACQYNGDGGRIPTLLRLSLPFAGWLAAVQTTQARYGNEGWGLIIISSLPVRCAEAFFFTHKLRAAPTWFSPRWTPLERFGAVLGLLPSVRLGCRLFPLWALFFIRLGQKKTLPFDFSWMSRLNLSPHTHLRQQSNTNTSRSSYSDMFSLQNLRKSPESAR